MEKCSGHCGVGEGCPCDPAVISADCHHQEAGSLLTGWSRCWKDATEIERAERALGGGGVGVCCAFLGSCLLHAYFEAQCM
jgi:hypothetical protein